MDWLMCLKFRGILIIVGITGVKLMLGVAAVHGLWVGLRSLLPGSYQSLKSPLRTFPISSFGLTHVFSMILIKVLFTSERVQMLLLSLRHTNIVVVIFNRRMFTMFAFSLCAADVIASAYFYCFRIVTTPGLRSSSFLRLCLAAKLLTLLFHTAKL